MRGQYRGKLWKKTGTRPRCFGGTVKEAVWLNTGKEPWLLR